ncbi:Wzz/FepE/Etk N-terminal domain-containing protein [Pseudomonas sp. S 311-6]|uniref:GumC family protein n=1 Tax=Pseudomonas TaxID=286 RepID=UPI001CE464BB|nr:MULTISPECIES: Wzz/FepE/Etk N-terminal domain-containing protein [Pseudomonas]MCO7642691.1 Wzz/FepE/Etk N-terminal domain-containing protein [Pseudomonas sp. S 311-6]MCO7564124.1 Wzz/FepE/Etk N-terminal domain-containing protein [Pseudomonas mosselii]MCO7593994.1 Wzz/FepE/Etk N-terminal domain-containing protein [Pseudomonas guariconensis]MCO7618513.1 Wzz/FepE/Etk N-terminal domain-containing protein [Pseudomonas guariconensis]MCO7631431.1 Wzz/FepE/Etk N-terminal domain-containing protein [P
MTTQPKENYVHEFFRIFFANRQLVKRVFLIFAVIAVVLPLVLKQSYDITAEVIVQSKKLSQSDTSSSLTQEADRFIPPSLADMETESNILRSPTLIRQTIDQLRQEGHYQAEPGLLQRYVSVPLREHVTDPLKRLFGNEVAEQRDTALDDLTDQAIKELTVETLPGSNVISVIYSADDPKLGTLFVQRLLDNFLKNRQDLQSNELPETFYEQKKLHYQARLGDLESQRLGLLEAVGSSDPKEEITFRLNAINTEEQALNLYRDRQLQNRQWLDYLKSSMAMANKARMTDYSFPYTFTTTVDNVAFEDREIKQLGEQLTSQVARYGADLAVFQASAEPMLLLREQIGRTRQQFLKIVDNRIRERQQDLAVTQQVIDQKTQRIADYKARIHQLRETQSKTRQLDTEIDALHKAFSTYAQRYEESRGQGLLDGSQSNARILSAPYEPTTAAFPKPGLIIPFGLLTGILLSIALVYIKEFFDHRFKHPAQIAHQLDLPVLLVINDQAPALPNPHRSWSLPRLMHWVRN